MWMQWQSNARVSVIHWWSFGQASSRIELPVAQSRRHRLGDSGTRHTSGRIPQTAERTAEYQWKILCFDAQLCKQALQTDTKLVARTLSIGEHIYLFDARSLAAVVSRAGLVIGQAATDYDFMSQQWEFKSGHDLILTIWNLARNAVKSVCKMFPKDAYGDIVYASLHRPQLE